MSKGIPKVDPQPAVSDGSKPLVDDPSKVGTGGDGGLNKSEPGAPLGSGEVGKKDLGREDFTKGIKKR